MEPSHLAILFLTAALGQGPGGQDDYYSAATAAARELATQLEALTRSFVTIPGPPEGRGLYKQADGVGYDLIYFRQQLKRKVSREDLYIAFDKVDGKLNTLLEELQPFEKWVPAVRMTARRVKSAQHDLQFALSGGDSAPARQGDALYRQTLVLLTRTEDLENMVRYLFDEQDSLAAWRAGFKEVRGQMADLQRLQKSKASADEVKKQFALTDQAWEKLVGKFKELPEDQHLILRSEFGQVDQVMARLAQRLGIQGRRAPLKAEFI